MLTQLQSPHHTLYPLSRCNLNYQQLQQLLVADQCNVLRFPLTHETHNYITRTLINDIEDLNTQFPDTEPN